VGLICKFTKENLEKEQNYNKDEINFLKEEKILLNQQLKKYEDTLKNIKFEFESCIKMKY